MSRPASIHHRQVYSNRSSAQSSTDRAAGARWRTTDSAAAERNRWQRGRLVKSRRGKKVARRGAVFRASTRMLMNSDIWRRPASERARDRARTSGKGSQDLRISRSRDLWICSGYHENLGELEQEGKGKRGKPKWLLTTTAIPRKHRMEVSWESAVGTRTPGALVLITTLEVLTEPKITFP